jgi:hypothetical protein
MKNLLPQKKFDMSIDEIRTCQPEGDTSLMECIAVEACCGHMGPGENKGNEMLGLGVAQACRSEIWH